MRNLFSCAKKRSDLSENKPRLVLYEFGDPMTHLSKIPEEEKTPLVIDLMHTLQQQAKLIEQLHEEIARLKEHKGKPKIPPSRLEKDPKKKEGKGKKNSEGKRPGSQKRSKTKQLIIHETIDVPPEQIPPGSTIEGYDEWIVQGLKIQLHNVCYRLARWRTPDGTLVKGVLPDSVDGHFNATLRSFILQQYNHGHVTQPLIWEELKDLDVDISKGQINRILTENKEHFHDEKKAVLCAGLEVSSYIHVDDTGARHAGKNGYCTHIGNEFFAWFESTGSKSRLNFLELLRNDQCDYVINEDALEYIKQKSFPQPLLEMLTADLNRQFETKSEWNEYLEQLAITKKRHVRIVTEGALLGSVLHHGFSKDMAIISDDAGQFNILLHALCWIHAERTIHKLIPCSEQEREAIENIRNCIWEFYRDLKIYKEKPDGGEKAALEKRFDDIFATKTCSEVLDAALLRLAKNKQELLLVLERPDIPLQNNLSERDIREYVKKRKISGGTRSNEGRRCRDTFTSLKKTCRKLGISFWDFLTDRITKADKIPPLPDLIRARAQSG